MLPERSWPFRVRPGSFEAVDSYLARLRAANHVSSLAWGFWSAQAVRNSRLGKTDAIPLIVEAVAGLRPGHFERDLAAQPRHADGETCGNCVTRLDERYACVRCHPGESVPQIAHDGPRVCRRHMMWVGPSATPERQHPVGGAVLRADRKYRRLRRQGFLDAHRLAEILDCVDAWVHESTQSMAAASRFVIAVELAHAAFRPHTIDSYTSRAVDAQERYLRLSEVVAGIAGTDDCIVLTDAVWLLLRAAGHQDQSLPHSFRCTPKQENIDEQAELDQLRSSRYPRGLNLHLTQYVASRLTGTRYARELHSSKLNDYVCSRGHRFEQRVLQLMKVQTGVGCPYCSRRKLLRGYNSMVETDPHLVRYWHPTLNGTLRPEDVITGSNRVVMWTCDEGHDHDMEISRKKRGTGCPYCTNKRVDKYINAFSLTHPKEAADWHSDLNGDLTPDQFVAGSDQEVWWKCPNEGHDFQMSIYHRSRGNSCPFCDRRKVHATTSFAVTHPVAAARWHPTKNGALRPTDVLAYTNTKVWWLCEEKKHHYFSSLLAQARGAGCNICTGRAVDEQNCMRTTRPDLARDFHPTANGSLTPDTIMATTDRRIVWRCRNNHHWTASGQNRVKHRTGCPYCSNYAVWVGWNDMATTRPDLAADWDEERNGDLTPQSVVAGTNKRIAWKCNSCGHRWSETGFKRVRRGRCANCSSSTR